MVSEEVVFVIRFYFLRIQWGSMSFCCNTGISQDIDSPCLISLEITRHMFATTEWIRDTCSNKTLSSYTWQFDYCLEHWFFSALDFDKLNLHIIMPQVIAIPKTVTATSNSSTITDWSRVNKNLVVCANREDSDQTSQADQSLPVSM